MNVYGKYGEMGFSLHRVNNGTKARAHYAFFSPAGNQLVPHYDRLSRRYYVQSRIGGRGSKIVKLSIYKIMALTWHGQPPTNGIYDAVYKPQHRRGERASLEPLAERLHNPLTVRWVRHGEIQRIPSAIEFAIVTAFEETPTLTHRELSERFDVSESAIGKVLRRYGAIK